MPASSSVRRIGGRISWFGTGRVMSQMRMQAFLRPRASSASGGVPIGLRQRGRDGAARDRPAARASRIASGPTTRSSGRSTSRPVRP